MSPAQFQRDLNTFYSLTRADRFNMAKAWKAAKALHRLNRHTTDRAHEYPRGDQVRIISARLIRIRRAQWSAIYS